MSKHRLSTIDAYLSRLFERLITELIAATVSPVSKRRSRLGQKGLAITGSVLSGLAIVLLLLAMFIVPTKPTVWLLPVLFPGVPGLILIFLWLREFSRETAQSVTRAAARERLEQREMDAELHHEGYDLDKIERKIRSGESFHVADDGEIAFDEKPVHKRSRHNF
jgi:hypothetical protein